MQTVYRIINDRGETFADGIVDHQFAEEVLHFKRLDHPTETLEIETYTRATVRGLGRDPDLH